MEFSSNQIAGFFDADGSFEAKVYTGKQKPISFHVNIIFSQKNNDVLQTVIDSLQASNSKGEGVKAISARNILNKSGTESIGNSISFAFSSNGGQALLNAWAKNPPKAPTKLLDFKISLILAEISASQTTSALDVVKNHLKQNSTVSTTDELTAGLALLWLRYRMFGKVKNNKNPNLLPIEHYYTKTGASQVQIAQSVAIGQKLFDPIEKEYKNHCMILENYSQKAVIANKSSVKICEDYLLGYHMGDGSFQIQTIFGKNNSTFRSAFRWSLTDCNENKPLLIAVKNYLSEKVQGTVGMTSYDTYYRLSLNNYQGCLDLVELFKGKPLPSTRLNQYNCFVKALNLYNLESFRVDLSKAEDFICLKWSMNPTTNSKKTGDLNSDLSKIRDWFNKNK